jgi:hypothetical protein
MTALSPSLQAVCVGCGSPTGTCTAAEGDADWIISYLIFLGLARELAEAAMAPHDSDPPPGARMLLVIPICMQCALRGGVLTALCIPGYDIPTTRQPERGQP